MVTAGRAGSSINAMVLNAPAPVDDKLLRWEEVPQPDAGRVVVQVEACGVCRTDLHV